MLDVSEKSRHLFSNITWMTIWDVTLLQPSAKDQAAFTAGVTAQSPFDHYFLRLITHIGRLSTDMWSIVLEIYISSITLRKDQRVLLCFHISIFWFASAVKHEIGHMLLRYVLIWFIGLFSACVSMSRAKLISSCSQSLESYPSS